MLKLRIYVEKVAGNWFGWIDEFPGAFVRGTDPDDVERNAPRAVTEYLSWLRLHDEPVPVELRGATSADFMTELAELISQLSASIADVLHLLPEDGGPIHENHRDRLFRLLRASRADLLIAANSMPPHEWDNAPFGGHSVVHLLQDQIADELNMLRRLGMTVEPVGNGDPIIALGRSRSIFESSIRELLDRQDRPAIGIGAKPDPRWSPAKAIRLAICNERCTAEQIADRLNPAAFMRSARRTEITLQHRESDELVEAGSRRSNDVVGSERHTHSSEYYY